MAINLVLNSIMHGPNKKMFIYDAYYSSTYTLNGTGDNIDLTASTNPDGSARNPKFASDAFPARAPQLVAENGGDMGGAYVGVVKPTTSPATNIKVRNYAAGGTETATGAAYPAGCPTTLATTNLQLFFTFTSGVD